MKTMCISLGGSVISKKTGVNVSYARKLYRLLNEYKNRYRFIITVGGGYATKLYVQSSKQFIKNNLVLDEIAIAITRINALMLKDLLSDLDVYPNVVSDLNELRMATGNNSIVVLGGLLPGMTTDAVAVLACELVGGSLLFNVSRNSYVYDRPPEEEGAKKLESISHDQLIEIASRYDSRIARSNFVFDLVASKLAKRSGIEIRFVNDDIRELKLALDNKAHTGTVVKS
jgi:uridylate kinase